MRMLSGVVFAWASVFTAVLPAQVQQFPYEAVVQGDNVYVRSGPGQRYYPTGQLRLGDRVTVHRHDPGGWYMIAPPAGSFSWIDASLVRKESAAAGIVQVPPLENGQSARAIVRIGSQLSDDCSVYSRNLYNGDRVEIIGEKTLTTDRGAVLMYQIKPPASEYRWVKGDYIVPAAAEVRAQHDRDPFGVPAAQKVPNSGVTDTKASGGVSSPGPQPAPASTSAGAVDALDREFAGMLSLDPAAWRLDEFEQQYRDLLQTADPATAPLIQKRLTTIAARRQAQADYLDFLRLTSETTQREELLRAMQNGGIPVAPTAFPQIRLGAPQPVPDGGTMPAAGPAGGVPLGANGPIEPSVSVGPQLGPQIEPLPEQPHFGPPNGPVLPKFDGAGIVQRSGNAFGTVPPYVLIAPDGRLLAFLEPAGGANLEPYVGQAMGVIGHRSFDPRLQADRIVVRRVHPVQLSP